MAAALESREFLASCLRAALEDPDLVDAITDTAMDGGLSATQVASGGISVEQLKDMLFLTSDEAQLFYNVCQAMVKKEADAFRAQHPDTLGLKLRATPSGNVSLRFAFNGQQPAPAVPRLASADASPPLTYAEPPATQQSVTLSSPAASASGLDAAMASQPSSLAEAKPCAVTADPPAAAIIEPQPSGGSFVPHLSWSASVPQQSGAVDEPQISGAVGEPQLPGTAVIQSHPSGTAMELQASSDPAEPEPLVEIIETTTVVVVSRRSLSPRSSKKLLESPMPSIPSLPPLPRPSSSISSIPSLPIAAAAAALATPPPEPTSAATPQTPVSAISSATAAGASTPRPPKPSPSPSGAARPKSAIPKPAQLSLTPEHSSPAVLAATSLAPSPAPSSTSSAKSTPHYLRPTAAHRARTTKEDSPGPLPSVPEEQQHGRAGQDLRRSRSLFDRMASTLLAPTQAFVARVTGRSEEMKAKKQSPVTKASVQLEHLLGSPAGQRVTKPEPFSLAARARGASCMLTTEELRLAEAREKTWKRNPVPKHVHESRPIVPVVRSEPKKPAAIFEPFNLASVELHNKRMEEKRKKEEEEAKAEEEARQFRARAFDSRIAAGPLTPRKPAASPTTVGVAPVFASDARIAHYHEVVEPVKKSKEAEANREKLEAERKAKELEDMSVEDFRKTLEFKARRMPDFSSPFRPDLTQAKPITEASEPQLHTVKRLGAAPSPGGREDKEGPGLGHGCYDGAGYVDPFFASLRKSTSVAFSGGARSSAAATARRSAMVRQSAAAACGRPGGGAGSPGVRGSVGTALQAAIRAAARDAARDLEAAGSASKRRAANVGSPAAA
ncbi:hypothetical protein GPECTOR_105g97 [Gonium pectorale]|uniref:TPX2 C-terminal domain-containing protein n=1 Tax=Gonium pectorale TaxID=33097 RepID=A0A150G0U1_GONPE|nr:hypothetical protein GPECTOR_105g97 [Gonium pectorale]|eukprot:KXZ43065.1 hypothetical protein GPECTOR_105g97 [Gonium pectorale]